MSIEYALIKKESALRSAQLAGSSQSTLESAYTAFTLDGAEVPEESFKTVILDIEAELTHIIASDASHPYRSYIAGLSASLANLANTPTQDASGSSFVGVFDSVQDASTAQPLTIQPTETLLDYQDPFFSDTELYNYSIVGQTIQHTRSGGVKMQGCIFDRADRETAYDADGESPLPPILVNTWIAGVLANLGQVGWQDGAGMMGTFSNLYQQGLQILRIGSTENLNLPLAARNQVSG